MSFKLLCILFCITLFAVVFGRQMPCTKSSDKTADNMFGHMVGYGNTSRRFPENAHEMEKYCSLQLGDIKVLENFTKKCKKGLPKQFFAIMMYTIKSNINRMCRKGSKKGEDFMSAAKCLNKATNELAKCHNVMIDRLQGVQIADDKMKIPHTCCEYTNLRHCLQEKGKSVDICNDKYMQTLDEFVESTTSNALNFFCGEYTEDNDKCLKLGQPPLKPKGQKRSKSISITIAEIFQSFPEQ